MALDKKAPETEGDSKASHDHYQLGNNIAGRASMPTKANPDKLQRKKQEVSSIAKPLFT